MVSVIHRINAAFGVSNKFVPYRPNWDLVADYAQSGGFQNSSRGGIINNADLNTISKTTFAVYNNPSAMPTSETGYCWVRTTIYDANAALQELFMFMTGVSYVRVRYNSETTWQTWKQITNA